MFANCMHAIVWRAFSLFFGISSIVWINHTFYCWRTVGLFPMFGFYKDAVCRTVFYESLCDCWGIKQLQWCSNGKGHSCAESTLCGTPRPLCIVSIGRWHFNASTFSQGTLSAGIPFLASQSEAERKNLATSVFSDCSGTLVCECRWSCFFFILPCCVTCGILVPWPGIEPGPSAVRIESPNHWTAREFSRWGFSLDIGMGSRW